LSEERESELPEGVEVVPVRRIIGARSGEHEDRRSEGE